MERYILSYYNDDAVPMMKSFVDPSAAVKEWGEITGVKIDVDDWCRTLEDEGQLSYVDHGEDRRQDLPYRPLKVAMIVRMEIF